MTWAGTADGAPPTRSPLFGRDAEIAEARRLLAGGARLVTLTGPGGIGKTRVAAEVCRGLPGRPVFLDLAGADDAGLPGILARGLVPPPASSPDPVTAIAEALAGQPRIVALDTFEHLTGSVPLLAELLDACRGLQLLVTSRSRLRLTTEQVLPLAALPGGPAGPAAEMFIERARAVGGFRMPGDGDAEQRTAIATLCELLDGSPLAIELAAARTTLFPPAALLSALQSGQHNQLRMLARGSGGNSARHRDMRSTIAWSYQLLGPVAQRLLRRLAVFAGSFGLDAAAQVGLSPGSPGGPPDGSDVLDDHAELVDLHLVEPAGGPADAPRFRLLDVLREFAAEQLGLAGEADAARAAFTAWMLDFADLAAAGLDSADQRGWLERAEQEMGNVRAALNLMRERGDTQAGARLAAAIGPLWENRGPMREGRQWFDAFLAADRHEPRLSDRARAAAIAWSGRMAIDEGHLDTGPIEAARDILAQQPGAAVDWLRATEHLAYGLTMRGELAAADVLTAQGIERATREDLPYWRCIFLLRRALSAQRHGDRVQAVRFAAETVAVARAIGFDRVVARAEQVAAVARGRELGPDGIELALRANLRAHEAAGDLRGVASTMTAVGAVTADPASAAQWFADGIDTAASIGYWHGEAYGMLGMAALLARAGRPLDAARLDGALRSHLPVLRAGIPPSYYAAYETAVAAARAAAGEAAFDRAAAELAGAGLAGGWAVARDRASALARELASAGGQAPAAAPPRRRGPRSNPELTAREVEVLAAIASGRTNPQIAADLKLSAKTVMHHSTAVYRKLGVRGRAEAVALGYRSGLLSHS